MIFVGYSAADPNIQAILSDIDEALPEAGGVIPNVYMVEWRKDINPREYPPKERLIPIQDGKGVRVKSITTADFAWIFDALASHQNHPKISSRVLRTLMVRSHELVRADFPKKIVEADFQFLEGALQSTESFAKMFGITTISDPSALSAAYPFNMTEVGKRIFSEQFKDRACPNKVRRLIAQLKKDTGFDMCANDNKYHRTEKYGKSPIHKYSEAACRLLKAVKEGQPFELS